MDSLVEQLDRHITIAVVGTIEFAKLALRDLRKKRKIIAQEALTDAISRPRYTFVSSRELLDLLFSEGPRGGLQGVIVSYTPNIDEYDKKVAQLCVEFGLKHFLVSPNGSNTSLYKQIIPGQRKKIEISPLSRSLAKMIKKAPGSVLVLRPDDLDAQNTAYTLREKLDRPVVDSQSNEQLEEESVIVSSRLNDELLARTYDAVVVSPTVTLEQKGGTLVVLPRTTNEITLYRFLLKDGGTLFSQSSQDQTEYRDDVYSGGTESYDVILATLYYTLGNSINGLDINDLEFMHRLNLVNLSGSTARVTEIGSEVRKYSWNIFPGLFLYYWQNEYKSIRYLFPGIVVAAFLEVLPRTPQPSYEFTDSFREFIDQWHRMREEVTRDLFLDFENVEKWIIGRDTNSTYLVSDWRRLMFSIYDKMARYRVKRPVLFTTEGLLERTLPLFQRIFSLTSNVLPIRDDIVVVLRSGDTPLITLPLLHKLKKEKETGKLPLLDSNLATQVYEPESSVLTMVRLPFVSSVNVLEVPRA